ncbi:hypothetical protein HHI36_006577 [Cryptolaemus montrouzieri]|uniref:Uncharacterized protein n=1 Tax=Cryptolaemus montrouzieri TaxID=559131 RepID=A0ABD2NXK5_9CUCU
MENNTLKKTNHILESKLAEDGKLLDQQNQELMKLKKEQRTLKQENLSLKKEIDHFKNQTDKEDYTSPSIHACKGDMDNRFMSLEKELQNNKQISKKQHNENAKKEISDANREKHGNRDTIIIGDVNLDLLSEKASVRYYQNEISANHFEIQNQIKENVTRISKTSQTILDHVAASKSLTYTVGYIDHFISDHRLLRIKVSKKVERGAKENKKSKELRRWLQKAEEFDQSEIYSFGDLAEV